MLFNKYPYTDMHELNLDWIIAKIKEVEGTLDDFVAYNKLTWLGAWNGNQAYPQWSVVEDGAGNGYLAIQAVPKNVLLTDTDYWSPVSSYNVAYTSFNARITAIENSLPNYVKKTQTVNSKQLTGNIVLNAADIPMSLDPSDDVETEIDYIKANYATKAEYGSPLTAATASAMTDTTRIYVYTGSEAGYTNGNWYYYNGVSWVSGGVYNASAVQTDDSLSVAGMAADAKASGQAIGDLDTSMSGGTKQLTKAELAASHIEYANRAIRADASYYGSDIASALSVGSSLGSYIYKINIAGADYVTYPLYQTGQINGTVIADENDIVVKGYYNTVENPGTLHTMTVPDNGKWLYFGTNSALEQLDYSVLVHYGNSLNYKTVKNILDHNDLLTVEQQEVSWVQGNVNPNGAAAISSSTTRCASSKLACIDPSYNYVSVTCPANMQVRITFWSNYLLGEPNLIPTASNSGWTPGGIRYPIPSGAVVYKVSVAYTTNTAIIPADCSVVSVFLEHGEINNEFEGKRLSILGDSISTYAGDNAASAGDGHLIADGVYTYAGNHCRYPNTYMNSVTDLYWYKLMESLGMQLGVNNSWAGSRVSWNGQEGSDYGANIYIASQYRIDTLDDNGTPDIILVNAGTNDIGLNVTIGTFNTESPRDYTDAQIAALPVATFADAYRALLIRLQKKYPLAQIVVMMPNFTTTYYDPEKADAYLEIIRTACDYFGVPCVDLRTTGINIYNTSTYTGDGIHPNVGGMNLLYEKMQKFFKFTL